MQSVQLKAQGFSALERLKLSESIKMKEKVVNFAPKEAAAAAVASLPSAPVLTFSLAARFLPDGRYVPAWLFDRAIQAVEDDFEGPSQTTNSHEETKVFFYPHLQIDIIKSNQQGRDNLRGTSARSSRPPIAPSHRDPRFHPTQPLNPDLGPGVYSLPSTFTPYVDKESAPFTVEARRPLFGDVKTVPFGEASHLLSHIEPMDMTEHLEKTGPKIRLDNKLPQRAPVQDYSYSTRFSQSRKELPPEPTTSLKIDSAGRLLTLRDKAVSNRLGAIPFESKSKKIDCYPSPSTEQGPGSYTPYTSVGGNGRRKSYRLAADPRHKPPNMGPSSPSFISTSRSQISGPSSFTADSTMRRTF